jgi:hypothetical protein
MRNTFGFIAIMGMLATVTGNVNSVTGMATVICIVLYLFYPNKDED